MTQAIPKKINVGIIGLSADGGWAAMAHYPALQKLPDHFAIQGLTASSMATAQKAAEKYGVPYYSDDAAALAARDDNPVLIAETGGQNAMIVDSTALAEQVCLDVINSAYDSAGQRCSALRILCLQDDIAERTLAMIKGAMNELRIADPSAMTTDIGPVIDAEAQQNLRAHIDKMKTVARAHHETAVADNIDPAASTYIAPILFELNNLDELQREVFGPVLHVLRYRAGELDSLLKQINQKGYALTHGIHSRIDSTIARITDQIEAGNIYVNRNIVGAVVGVQPFGGHGLSGTGPKAGGSFYLQKLSQGGAWQAPTLDRAGAPDTTALPKLQALIAQSGLDNDAQNRLKAAAEAAQKTTLRHAVQTLGGPTGENNQISWHLPPHIALYGGDLERGLSALIPVAIAGGHLHVAKDHPLALLEKTADGLIRVSAEPVSDHARHVLALEPLPAALKTARAAIDAAGSAMRLGVYANAFAAHGTDEEALPANDGLDEIRADLTPAAYLDWAKRWRAAGADIIGGCCGVGPEHIAAIAAWRAQNA